MDYEVKPPLRHEMKSTHPFPQRSGGRKFPFSLLGGNAQPSLEQIANLGLTFPEFAIGDPRSTYKPKEPTISEIRTMRSYTDVYKQKEARKLLRNVQLQILKRLTPTYLAPEVLEDFQQTKIEAREYFKAEYDALGLPSEKIQDLDVLFVRDRSRKGFGHIHGGASSREGITYAYTNLGKKATKSAMVHELSHASTDNRIKVNLFSGSVESDISGIQGLLEEGMAVWDQARFFKDRSLYNSDTVAKRERFLSLNPIIRMQLGVILGDIPVSSVIKQGVAQCMVSDLALHKFDVAKKLAYAMRIAQILGKAVQLPGTRESQTEEEYQIEIGRSILQKDRFTGGKRTKDILYAIAGNQQKNSVDRILSKSQYAVFFFPSLGNTLRHLEQRATEFAPLQG